MKKHYLLWLSAIALVATIVFVHLAWKRQPAQTQVNTSFLPRQSNGADTTEWQATQQAVAKLQNRLQQKPGDKATLIALANYMIFESRASGFYSHYDAAAMHYINAVLQQEPNHFEALCLKGLVQLSQHHFHDALATAQQAQQINPYSAFVYGILTDAYTQIGEYEHAVAAAEKMMEIKPDQRCYARVAYLRELHGDYPGAKEAMLAAVEAGVHGQESTEWCRVQLGNLYAQTGNWDTACSYYDAALAFRPGFASAWVGLGDAAMAQRNFSNGNKYYTMAANATGENQFADKIALSVAAMGNSVMADSIYRALIAKMETTAREALNDESKGHYTDKEIAEVLLLHNDVAKALHYAQLAYNRQPGNIEVNESLAWCYFKTNNITQAKKHIEAALRTHCQNPRLLCRAGLIYMQLAEPAKAKQMLIRGLEKPTVLLPALQTESKAALARL
jgi:tetratricopeptide (TPR) repeat protein